MKSIDQDALGALLELDLDTGGTLIIEMIASFRSELPKRLPRMMELLTDRNGVKLAFEAHAIKSTFANFGALSTARIFQTIEQNAKSETWDEVEKAVKLLSAAVAEFESDLMELEKVVNDPVRRTSAS